MNDRNRSGGGNAVATIEPSRLALPPAIAKEFSVEAADWRVLVDQIFPSAKTAGSVLLALSYCRRRNLDIFKKPVHIVPMWSTAKGQMVETVWPGIAEIRTTAARTGKYAGIDAVEFGPMIPREFVGETTQWEEDEQTGRKHKKKVTITKQVLYPEWASVVVYKMLDGQRCAYHAKVYWEEAYATIGKTNVPNEMWEKRPRGQLDKCVEAAALRKAFPEELGNTYAAEEMEGRTIDHAASDAPATASAAPPDPHAEDEAKENHGGEVEDAEFEEVPDDEKVEDKKAADPKSKPKPVDKAKPAPSGGAPNPDDDDDDDDGDGSEGDSHFFALLRETIRKADTEEEVEEVWTDADPMARFEGNEVMQKTALAIKNVRLKQLQKAQ
jgi:phage recombination protein Bet